MRSLLWVLLLLALAACQQVDANARFSCDAGSDCGEGFECRAQFSGGSRCFKLGECVDTEVCNGADDNCDGRFDETFPEEGQACVTGKQGECAAGTQRCLVGTLDCVQTLMPTAEVCNARDDDCNGAIDDTFDFTADESNCGGCGQSCDAGTTCLGATCQETLCDDGADNDLDGVIDCLDVSCLGQVCVTPMAPSWRCGALVVDAGVDDAGVDDAGVDDAGVDDAGVDDAGVDDAGVDDAGVDDAGVGDAGVGDAGVGDAGLGDAGLGDAGVEDAGADAGTSDGGPVLGCYAPEQDCANGLDDDGDGEADCLDVDCGGRVCVSGTICTNRSCPGPG